METKILKIALILLTPIVLPPVLYYHFNIPAHAVLGTIIAIYLPLWYKLNYMDTE